MRALLDTHALLWCLSDDPGLGRPARRFIAEGKKDSAVVSAACASEIATKVRLGKLPTADLGAHFVGCLEQEGFDLLPIPADHAIRVGLLPGPHKDPLRPGANRASPGCEHSDSQQ